nr:glycosyltransferase family 4 protein [Paenibacillus artemisiicola]
MIQLALNGLDRLVSVDSHFQTYCRAVCTFDDPEKLVLLPNAVDTAWFAGADEGTAAAAGTEADGDATDAGDTEAGVTGAGDTGAGDTGAGDTGAGDTSAGGTGAGDTGAGDTGAGDTGAGDTGAGDTSAGDTGAGDTSADDTSAGDTSAGDTSAGDTSAGDTSADNRSEKTGGGITAERLNAVSGGDPDAEASAGPPDEKLRLLFPRRLSYERGIVPMMLLADLLLAEFPELTVEFAGELVEQTPVAVAFREWLATHPEQARVEQRTYAFEEVRDAYLAADVVVIPTVYSEGTSLSCLEAMSCGRAVVATNVGGLNDLVTDGYNGRLVPPTVDALAAAVRELLADPALRGAYGADARRTAQAFDLRRWQRRWRELLETQFARIGR